MSYVRILEYHGQPKRQQGEEWYAVEGREASVRLVRDDAALESPAAPGPDLAANWVGARIMKSGADRKGAMVYMLKYPVPDDFAWEFDAWFRFEHMPLLHEEPTWYACDFYRAVEPSSYPFAAIHYLEPGALKSAARDRSIVTPWWNRLKAHDWFDKGFIRTRMTPL